MSATQVIATRDLNFVLGWASHLNSESLSTGSVPARRLQKTKAVVICGYNRLRSNVSNNDHVAHRKSV
jgi:hypothetical protein